MRQSRFYIEITDLGVTIYDKSKGDQPRVCEKHWPARKNEVRCECCQQIKRIDWVTDPGSVRDAIEECERLNKAASQGFGPPPLNIIT